MLHVLVCLFVFFNANPVFSKDELVVYPVGDNSLVNNDYSVNLKLATKEGWQDNPVYRLKVDKVTNHQHTTETAAMSSFDFSGEVEVVVRYNAASLKSVRIRPLSYGIVPEVNGNTIRFKLNQPRNLSIEVNGDIFHNLHLFANPLESFIPNRKDKNLIYFAPGVHEIKDGVLLVPSGKTVFLAGGAILKGQVKFRGVENAKLLGRGMVAQADMVAGVKIENSRDIEVEGIFCTQCFTGGSENVLIRNVKSISYYKWGDGMNVVSSNNVTLDGVFNRNSDDCTTVYGSRNEFRGGCNNVTMKNSTLWADVAHPILVGTHGNTPNPDILQNLTYSNIDILDHNEAQIDYQGCMSLNAGDNNLIRNVRFENIRVEDFRQGQLLNLRVFYNSKYCTSPGRGIENVLFKNIVYNGKNAEVSVVSGYDDTRNIKNVTFDNLVINGEKINDNMKGKPGWYKTSDMARIFVGEHVEGVKFSSN
ncbi:MAG TPA: glycosyl hydrolase family 28 protein [Paludibacter sp.]|nr:glycosyl hydrolase family 28 protein [Paludibacter sp.]